MSQNSRDKTWRFQDKGDTVKFETINVYADSRVAHNTGHKGKHKIRASEQTDGFIVIDTIRRIIGGGGIEVSKLAENREAKARGENVKKGLTPEEMKALKKFGRPNAPQGGRARPMQGDGPLDNPGPD